MTEGRPSSSDQSTFWSPAHIIGQYRWEPGPPARMNQRMSARPDSSTASRLHRAQSTGHALCAISALSPLARTASVGRYSPKSAIHPERPSPMRFRLMTPLYHANAAGLVKSTMPAVNSPKSTR